MKSLFSALPLGPRGEMPPYPVNSAPSPASQAPAGVSTGQTGVDQSGLSLQSPTAPPGERM